MTAPLGVLVTGASSPIGQAVAGALRDAGRSVKEAGDALTDPQVVAPLVAGVGAIVHLAPLSLPQTMPEDAPGEVLDAAARGTHVLFTAALEAGVRRAIVGSTLAVMDAYPEELEVTEQWRPRPRPRPAELAPYLAELTAREFTRDVQIDDPPRITCLRFATDLAPADAADAVSRALDALEGVPAPGSGPGARRQGGHRWGLYHIAPPDPTARYSSAQATQALGYGRPAGDAGVPEGAAR